MLHFTLGEATGSPGNGDLLTPWQPYGTTATCHGLKSNYKAHDYRSRGSRESDAWQRKEMKGKRVEGGVGGGGRMGRREKGKREGRRNVSEKGGRKFSGRWVLCLDLCVYGRTSLERVEEAGERPSGSAQPAGPWRCGRKRGWPIGGDQVQGRPYTREGPRLASRKSRSFWDLLIVHKP